MINRFIRQMRYQQGQGFVEYALLIVIVALAAVGSMSMTGESVGGVYGTIICAMGEGGSECGCGYERVMTGPTYTCTGGIFAVEGSTSCDRANLSVLVENPDGAVEEIGMTYDPDNKVWAVAHTDSSDICSRIAGSPLAVLVAVAAPVDQAAVVAPAALAVPVIPVAATVAAAPVGRVVLAVAAVPATAVALVAPAVHRIPLRQRLPIHQRIRRPTLRRRRKHRPQYPAHWALQPPA
jgi:Flp pilus assembly pilin Flp